jgi:hypothetical protein
MNLVNQTVIHKSFGEGKVTEQSGNYLTITFGTEEKKFIYPDSSNNFVGAKGSAIDEQVMAHAESSKKMRIEEVWQCD